MSIKDRVSINVLNENEFIVCATSQVQGHKFTPSSNGVPSMNPMSFAEIQFINGKSDAFRSGLLRFDPECEKEVYEALTIPEWKNIVTNKFIEDAIVNSNMEKLQRLVDITNPSVFDRVKTILIRMQNSGAVDISNRVINTLMARDDELRHRKYKSEIVLKVKEKPVEKPNEEMELMKSQLAEMKQMLAQFMSKGDVLSETKTDEESNSPDNTVDKETKKRGKPTEKSK